MRYFLLALACLMLSAPATAQTPDLQPELKGLAFLVGHWTAPSPGELTETGGGTTGEADFTPQAGGAVLLRRDHVIVLDKSGKASGGFDILMTVYVDVGALQADYFDGDHHIHYASAMVEPGRSVVFSSAASPTATTFRLSYVLKGPTQLEVAFSMAPAGTAEFRPIATGRMTKER